MKGRLTDLSIGMNGKQRVTVEIDGDFRENYDALKDAYVRIDIKKHRKGRSLDANAYAWVLIDKIAGELSLTKLEVYRNAIRNVGGVSETICVKENAAAKLMGAWCSRGIGWQAETMPSKINGCVNVTLYYGSSVYDSKQMSLLIDCLVADAKDLGIETATEEQIERYKDEWAVL